MNQRRRNEMDFSMRCFLLMGLAAGILLGEHAAGYAWWVALLVAVVVLLMTVGAIWRERREWVEGEADR